MKKLLLILLFSLAFCGRVECVDYTQDANCTYVYTCEEGSGDTLNDSSANNLDGAMQGGQTWATASPPKAYSTYYLDFSGDATEWIDAGVGSSNDIQDPMSFCAWIDYDSWPNNDAVWYSNSHYLYTYDTVARSLRFSFVYGGTGSVYSSNANAVPAVNTWFHLYWELNNGVVEAYVDGIAVSTGVGWGTAQQGLGGLSYDNPVDIFGQGASRNLNGRIDEIGFFFRTLSSTEINDIMDNGLVGGAAPPTTMPMSAIGSGIGSGIMRGGR